MSTSDKLTRSMRVLYSVVHIFQSRSMDASNALILHRNVASTIQSVFLLTSQNTYILLVTPTKIRPLHKKSLLPTPLALLAPILIYRLDFVFLFFFFIEPVSPSPSYFFSTVLLSPLNRSTFAFDIDCPPSNSLNSITVRCCAF